MLYLYITLKSIFCKTFFDFWSNNLGYYNIDNLLNLFSYKPEGKMFATFYEWNNKAGRRIIRGSHGVPILQNDRKIYVFDISQTWGKPFYVWKYNNENDEILIKYYKDKYKTHINLHFLSFL